MDPLAEKYPGWSSYNYVMNNPINMVDPDGREARQSNPPNPITNYIYSLIKKNYNVDGQSLLRKKESALNYLPEGTNTCAIRMSEALNHAGYGIPTSQSTPSDVRIQNGKEVDSGNFVLDAASMGNYLTDIESPTLSLNNLNTDDLISDAMRKIEDLGDFKGIVVLTAGNRKAYRATGHVDLIYEDFWGDASMYSMNGTDLEDYLIENKESNLSIKIWAIKPEE